MRIIQTIGNKELWKRDKILFLASKRTPYERYGNIFRWVESLTSRDCVACFNTSELEVEVMKALVENGIPTVLIVMNRFREQNNIQIEGALNMGRMLVLVLERDEPKNAGATPRLRNEFIASQVQRIICGFVSPHGSIRPLVAGRPNVTYLKSDAEVCEPESFIHRWSVGEDKTLLRMFYEDHSIHAIKKRLHRSYAAIRMRLRSLTMPEDVLKGREFEDFVLELLSVENNEDVKLLEWRGDKQQGSIFPESNHYPDFLLEYHSKSSTTLLTIECKWRQRLSIPELFDESKIEKYRQYANERNARMLYVLGIGGQPCAPEEVYLVPIEAVKEINVSPAKLNRYRLTQPESALLPNSPELRPLLSPETKHEKHKAHTLSEIRKRYPNAYRPWTQEDDAALIRLHRQGLTNKELSARFRRQPSAISSRIRKLEEFILA
ncbi:MAG: hypothetical protein IJ729_03440 [Alloprevotella sp.]|nr:hypothetical protein [Alloprevotella sp.]